MIKVFGIGNPLLRDDAIGIEVAKKIKEGERVKTYITEIFVEEALEEIEEEDYVIVIDAVYFGAEVGELHRLTFEECVDFVKPKAFCHDRNLLTALLLGNQTVKGELIGIEVADINYGEGLSYQLAVKLPDIIEKVKMYIEEADRKEVRNARSNHGIEGHSDSKRGRERT